MYDHENVPDGTVDMIFMIWRSPIKWFGTFNGIAKLGFGTSYGVENDSKVIKTDYGLNRGSGITVHHRVSYSKSFGVTIHEFGHWLLGLYHPYGGGDEHAIWGILAGGQVANSFERERLGWINCIPVTSEITANLSDYLTTGSAYKFHPLNGEQYEYYYFENHHKLNEYDNVSIEEKNKAIFVLHQQDIYRNQNNIKCKTSDGNWNWNNPYWVPNQWAPPGSPYVPVFERLSANRAGYNHRDALPNSQSGYGFMFVYLNNGVEQWGVYNQGEYFDESYRLNYNKSITTYSNPTTKTWAGTATDFGMEIISEYNNTVTVHFYYNNDLDGSPSKPQNLSASPVLYPPHGTYITRLTWDANLETDINRYYIYRQLVELPNTIWEDWTQVGSTTGTSFDDTSFEYFLSGNTFRLNYKIRAKDNSGKYSNYSEPAHVDQVSPLFPKQAENLPNDNINEGMKVLKFDLKDNFPNPFNPRTTISFDLPEDIVVSLKIFDLSGRKIRTLVNEPKSAGTHQVVWNGQDDHGNSVASGLYVYRIQAGDFVQSRKMLFMK